MASPAEVLATAQRFYWHCGPGSWAYHHMRTRKLAEMIRPACIGYAPPGWMTTTRHLMSLGYSVEDLLRAGVSVEGERGLRDLMHDRLTFPIRDHTGQLVGFLGRAGPAAARTAFPKYLNTPATELYKKRSTLYGLGERVDALSSGSIPLIVEGPMDRLAVEQVAARQGLPVVGLAACGTGLTAEHVARVRAITGADLWFCFDADPAGQRAMLRAWNITASQGCGDQRVVQLPFGEDPASVDPDVLAGQIRRAVPMSVAVAEAQLRVWGRPDSTVKAELMVSSLASRDAARVTPQACGDWITTVARWTDLPVSCVQESLVEQVAPRPSRADLDTVRAVSFPRPLTAPADAILATGPPRAGYSRPRPKYRSSTVANQR